MSNALVNNDATGGILKPCDSNECNVIDAKEDDYLYTNLSEIPNAGKGLFTAIKIFKDEIIAVYRGEIITDSEAEIRINQLKDQYFIVLLDGQILDSKNSNCFAKYANDAEAYKNRRFINNAKIGLDESDNVCLIAKKNIPSGSEIFCSYGKSYWKKHGKLNLKNN